jgi:hypothetical protein
MCPCLRRRPHLCLRLASTVPMAVECANGLNCADGCRRHKRPLPLRRQPSCANSLAAGLPGSEHVLMAPIKKPSAQDWTVDTLWLFCSGSSFACYNKSWRREIMWTIHSDLQQLLYVDVENRKGFLGLGFGCSVESCQWLTSICAIAIHTWVVSKL